MEQIAQILDLIMNMIGEHFKQKVKYIVWKSVHIHIFWIGVFRNLIEVMVAILDFETLFPQPIPLKL